jgi:hypothetical protein
MVQKIALLILILLFVLGAGPVGAQDDQPPATSPGSTVTIFVVICEDQAVVNFSGTMQPGFDLYYQIFSGSQGSGTALTSLRRVQVSGEYAFSERVTYTEGATVPFGSIGSAYVTISRAGNPDSSAFNEYVDDIQDGCADPQFGLDASVDAGTGVSAPDGVVPATSILSPFGGVINPGYVPPARPLVVIGPREELELPRQQTPGIIFAECNAYPIAKPGILYDTDNIIIFWSWFASTPELVQEHIDTVDYAVTYYGRLPLPQPIVRTEIQQRDRNYWVFYYSQLGNLRPGHYYIEYKANWSRAISDGYESFGPGTETEQLVNSCGFDILPNLEGREVEHSSWPFNFLAPGT